MAKPNIANAAIATATNFSTGPKSGTPTKVDGGSLVTNQGFIPGTSFVGTWTNHKLNQFYQWCQYVDGFESEPHAWSGDAQFKWATPRTFTKMVPWNLVIPDANNVGWKFYDSSVVSGYVCNVDSANTLRIDLSSLVPHGATLTGVHVRGKLGQTDATASNRMAFTLRLREESMAAIQNAGFAATSMYWPNSTTEQLFSVFGPGGSYSIKDSGNSPASMTSTAKRWELRCWGSANAATTNDLINSIWVDVTEPQVNSIF